jgi:lysine 2,3-aminomutase
MINMEKEWNDWKWQQRNAVTSVKKLNVYFPNLHKKTTLEIEKSLSKLNFRLTPYLISLIKKDEQGNPFLNDPIWLQSIPNSGLFENYSNNLISDFDVNWELQEEMINPILQHKYANRVVLRIQNKCLSYCMYCFESKRTLNLDPTIQNFNDTYFAHSLEYIRNNTQIQEVILSGGEPLLVANEKIKEILKSLKKISHIKIIRIHTRVLTHNPFRIDDELVRILSRYDVTALTFHFTHPNEITKEVISALKIFNKYKSKPIFLAHIPLLKRINDNAEILASLFMSLYSLKIIPYYLFHAMPDTLGANEFRTSVKSGVKIMRKIKRKFSNPAIPEYVIVHKTTKHTVPFELDGTSEFKYCKDVVKFKNYKGEWCEYSDTTID